jgi:hypothetical protein
MAESPLSGTGAYRIHSIRRRNLSTGREIVRGAARTVPEHRRVVPAACTARPTAHGTVATLDRFGATIVRMNMLDHGCDSLGEDLCGVGECRKRQHGGSIGSHARRLVRAPAAARLHGLLRLLRSVAIQRVHRVVILPGRIDASWRPARETNRRGAAFWIASAKDRIEIIRSARDCVPKSAEGLRRRMTGIRRAADHDATIAACAGRRSFRIAAPSRPPSPRHASCTSGGA